MPSVQWIWVVKEQRVRVIITGRYFDFYCKKMKWKKKYCGANLIYAVSFPKRCCIFTPQLKLFFFFNGKLDFHCETWAVSWCQLCKFPSKNCRKWQCCLRFRNPLHLENPHHCQHDQTTESLRQIKPILSISKEISALSFGQIAVIFYFYYYDTLSLLI